MTFIMNPNKIEPFLQRLSLANRKFSNRFPGKMGIRQPIHTVYGGAHLYTAQATQKISTLALRHFQSYTSDHHQLSAALNLDCDAQISKTIYQRITKKLETEAIEDHRADFEDGYGVRTDAEEDSHAELAAEAMADVFLKQQLPPFVGIRIKALSEESKHRSLRTLNLFICTFLKQSKGVLPPFFTVTLPKVTSEEQVKVICEYLNLLEAEHQLKQGDIHLELMLENVQCLFTEAGEVALPKMIAAGKGRVSSVVLGTFDYTASCNIASSHQSHQHPAADFARQMMIASLADTTVSLCDGITNIMPIAPNKGALETLTAAQIKENQEVIYKAWRLHFDNITHSLHLGIYQGWDLNPAQIPIRFAAVFYFFLKERDTATARLRAFIDKAAQASMVGNTFDDAATGQGLVNFFVEGLSCGALTESEVLTTGITLEELNERSFLKIVENRTQEESL